MAPTVASQFTQVGSAGLGAGTQVTRIFGKTALTFGGRDYLYVVGGTGSNAVRVYCIAD